jgi:C-3',4' desaturase CrtD
MPGNVVVIGAGVGGLTTAACLAKRGWHVTVLEAHVYPGGCAGTFYHKKYRFEAGATLAAGFGPNSPMEMVGEQAGIDAWPIRPDVHIMDVHLPSGRVVTRWGDERRNDERAQAFGDVGTRFWAWQERAADAMWPLAMRLPPWPPQSPRQVAALCNQAVRWLATLPAHARSPALALDGIRAVKHHLRGANDDLLDFVDAQLLIAAQATSEHTNALYGASALDLPRRGVVHVKGGIGGIAQTLVDALQAHGGTYLQKHEVSRIQTRNGQPIGVETTRGKRFPADVVVANLTPWSLAKLYPEDKPRRLRHLPEQPRSGGGAFMVYVGLDRAKLPTDLALHHQVIQRRPLGEGNTVFLSLAPSWDTGRAPEGHVPLTISTHTALGPWWERYNNDKQAYEDAKAALTDTMLDAASVAIPSLRSAAHLVVPGTPVTFYRFTKRAWGWVGGFPQTNLFRAWAARMAPHTWMVGDTIFPGQSTAAVALGGLRVANDIHHCYRP